MPLPSKRWLGDKSARADATGAGGRRYLRMALANHAQERPVRRQRPPVVYMRPLPWAPPPAPTATRYGWLVVLIIAIVVGGPILAWGAFSMRQRLQTNYLESPSETPRAIERAVGCKPCRVSRITLMKDSLVVSMADPSSDRNQLWDISGIGGFPREGWDLGRATPEEGFDPRDVDWEKMQEEATAWQKRTLRKTPAWQVTLARCAAERERICFTFQ